MGYDDGWGGSSGFNSYSNRNDKHKLPVFKDVDLSKVNILKDFKTMPGKIVFNWMGQPKAFFPDRIDRLNGYIVPALFLLCVAVLSTTVYGWIGGEAISCLSSKDLHSKDEYEYAVDYCMSKNHYYVHPDEQIPWSDQQRYASQLGYYHWVMVFLLMQAFFFWLPSCLWSYASTATGINFAGMLGFAKQINKKCHPRPLTHEDRPKLIDTLAAEIEDSLSMRAPQRVMGLRFGRRIGSYAVTLYLLIKLVYIVNVSAQFLLLNAFLGGSYAWWGLEVLESLITGENWQDSPVFPRLTLCDVPIRRLADSPRYTLQCHLRVNTYNEKVFFLIWWFLAFVAAMTALNLVSYLFSFCFWPFCCHTREDYVRFLCRDRRHRDIMWSFKKADVAMVQNFADNCLGNDGVLLFMFIGDQAGFITAREVMVRLFDNYRWRWENPSKPVPDDIAYKTMNALERSAVIPTQNARKTSAPKTGNDPSDQNTSSHDWPQSTTDDNNGDQNEGETTNDDNFNNTGFSSSSSNFNPLNRGRGRRGNVR